jgi:hypothetical protein
MMIALTDSEKAHMLEGARGTEPQRTACRFFFVVTFVTIIPALVLSRVIFIFWRLIRVRCVRAVHFVHDGAAHFLFRFSDHVHPRGGR